MAIVPDGVLLTRHVKSCAGGLTGVMVCAATLAMAALQVACIDISTHPPAARNSPVRQPNSSIAHQSRAAFGLTQPSSEVRQLANAILLSSDHAGQAFIIVDKRDAMVFVFTANGILRGASPVLLGSARGDDSVPDIGLRPLSQVRPEERTTPAGRFVAERGTNTTGEDIVWVDYDAAVSMHRVRTTNLKERRLERLASSTTDDNRISYGCINVPVDFFDSIVAPTFASTTAMVYVLPEVKPVQHVFSFYPFLANQTY